VYDHALGPADNDNLRGLIPARPASKVGCTSSARSLHTQAYVVKLRAPLPCNRHCDSDWIFAIDPLRAALAASLGVAQK